MAPSEPRRVSFQATGTSSRATARRGPFKIKRFDGLTGRSPDWSASVKDEQLWWPDGDCVVFFGSHGPRLRLPLTSIKEIKCDHLWKHCRRSRTRLGTGSPLRSAEDSPEDSGYASSPTEASSSSTWELRVPDGQSGTLQERLNSHLTTRNFFAYALNRAVVGERLGTALIDLWRRVQEWLPEAERRQTFTEYLAAQGYLDFAANADHALACLQLAGEARFRDIWVDAFAHCVGMYDRLDLSSEFGGLPRATVASITRASLEMDLNITRATRAAGAFLEDELGADVLGVSAAARTHLDRFRSFLHRFYGQAFGYFPPREGEMWNRRVWEGVWRDFRCLYDLLADTDSNGDLASNRQLGGGGICVIQNVRAFDERHGFDPLAHPLPLLPVPSAARGLGSPRSFRRSRTNLLLECELISAQGPSQPCNPCDGDAAPCPLVLQYQRFEQEKLDGKLEAAEARKVRWLLVYGMLQMLNTLFDTPDGVRDADEVTYPLCVPRRCLLPRWLDEADLDRVAPPPMTQRQLATVPDCPSHDDDDNSGRTSRISIRPDCDAESADDFFISNNNLDCVSRRASHASLNPTPSLRVRTSLGRTGSLRSSVHYCVSSLQRSVAGSMTRRNSGRRLSIQSDMAKHSPCESVQENVPFTPLSHDRKREDAVLTWSSTPSESHALAEFDFDLAAINGEPTLESHQLEVATHVVDPRTASDSGIDRSDSNRSSEPYLADDDDDGDQFDDGNEIAWTEPSSWSNFSNVLDSIIPSPSITFDATDGEPVDDPLAAHHSGRLRDARRASVNVGCYVPTGLTTGPAKGLSPAAPRRVTRTCSDNSDASIYPDEPRQAVDIEEEAVRGRQRSRELDRLVHELAAAARAETAGC